MATISKTENRVLMAQARAALENRWGLAIGTAVVWVIALALPALIPIFGSVYTLVVGGPMSLGITMFYLSISRRQEATFGQAFSGFSRFGEALAAYVVMSVFVALWALLLIIPGIIKSYSYALTFYILGEDSSVGPVEAITRSKQMMDGNKWKLFCLHWRFFGWTLVGILTCGIGFLWIVPYMGVAGAQFYDDVKGNTDLGDSPGKL